jgi:CRP-like cAMP-binding protein
MLTTQAQAVSRAASFKHPVAGIRHAPPVGKELPADSLELMGALMSFARNSEIYGENEPADYLYKVVSGTVRTYKVLFDGRRQIGGFHLAGDIFGFETGEEHTFSAEAITDCKILVIKRSTVIALAARDNDIARQMGADRARTAACSRPYHGPDQECPGAGRRLSSRNGRSRIWRRSRRASDVPPGHCRLSRSDHRNRLADAHPIGKNRCNRASDLAPYRQRKPLWRPADDDRV